MYFKIVECMIHIEIQTEVQETNIGNVFVFATIERDPCPTPCGDPNTTLLAKQWERPRFVSMLTEQIEAFVKAVKGGGGGIFLFLISIAKY